ncbi:MAG: cation:proton antiporter, partial [Myxococcota bacterium]
MLEGSLLVVVFVLAFAALSRRLEATPLTAPMVFTAFGMLISPDALGLLDLEVEDEVVHLLAELTLVLVLFADASRIDTRALRRELGLPVRLLGIGLPLTIAAGLGAGLLLFPGLGVWEALVLAAVLAPTDAALGQAVVSAEVVPLRIRQALNVESGLNDGIAVPVVLVAVALAQVMGGAGDEPESWVLFTALQVGLGPVAGLVGGGLLAAVLGRAYAAGAMNEAFARLAGLLLA